MPVASLEVQRARKLLEAFCARRSDGAQQCAKRLCCQQDGEDLLVVETRVSGQAAATSLVRLSYRHGCWLLFCPDQRGGWVPYPHLPTADRIQLVIDELEQAPLHVHWG